VTCPVPKSPTFIWIPEFFFDTAIELMKKRMREEKGQTKKRPAKESEEILPDLDSDWIDRKSSIWGGVYFISVYIPLRLRLFFSPVSTL
jgi:hypothetical protein